MAQLVALEKKSFPKLRRRTIPEERGKPCSKCGADEWYSRSSGGYHCHDNGEVRELLCRSCNFLVGFYEQGGDLKAVEDYVKRHRAKLQVMA